MARRVVQVMGSDLAVPTVTAPTKPSAACHVTTVAVRPWLPVLRTLTQSASIDGIDFLLSCPVLSCPLLSHFLCQCPWCCLCCDLHCHLCCHLCCTPAAPLSSAPLLPLCPLHPQEVHLICDGSQVSSAVRKHHQRCRAAKRTTEIMQRKSEAPSVLGVVCDPGSLKEDLERSMQAVGG